MKRRIFKRVLSVFLAVTMVFALAACGSKNAGNENDQASKLYVYSYEDVDLGLDMDNMSVYSMQYMNDRLYVLLQDYSGQFSAAAGAKTAVALPEVEAEVEIADEAVEDVIVDGDMMVEPDEYVYYGPTYVLISAKMDGSDRQHVILDLGEENQENAWMNRVVLGSNGTVIGTQEVYREDFSDPNNPIYETINYLLMWDTDGKLVWKKDMAEFIGDEAEYYYPRDILSLNDGSIAFFSYEGLGAVVDANGNLVSKLEFDEEMASSMGNILQKSDGTTYVTSYNNEWTKMYISTFDLKTGTFGDKTELPGNMTNFNFYTGTTTDFVLTNNIGVYTYNIGDEEPVQIMDYINSDFPSSYINSLVVIDDTHMLGYYNDQTDWKIHFSYFTKVNPEDVPDKKTMLLGCYGLDYNVRNRVVAYNKSNPNYRIAIKDYSVYSTMEDWSAGLTQLNNDIISHQMPDILVVNNSMNTNSYISKGAFADIGKLIDEDEELSQMEFVPNMREAFSVGGKLYTVVPSFSIQTMAGKKSILGEKDGWTMAEMKALSDSLPEDCTMFGPDMLRDSFLYQVMRFLGNDFIDPVTGKCSFDSPEFISLLEYAKTFPKEHPEEYWEDYDYSLYESMYREDRAILMELYMSNIRDLKYNLKGMFGEPVNFIGFPVSEGNGSIISPSYQSFAISAESKNMDAAWDFVRYYLTDEYQNSEEFYEFPVSKNAFMKKAKEATERPYWTDENGNKIEYDDTYYINGEEIILEPFTQEEIDEISEFIFSVNKTSSFEDDIRMIITEEAASFFEGQKSAQEVATIIQSRAQVFVDENR